MASKTCSAAPMTAILLVGFLILISAGSIRGEWLIQGPCANYPNCDKYCRENGFRQYGGKCIKPSSDPGAVSFCACYAI
ncbi:hypothetical protein M569_10663 [Genlisea aurea]|uniref:Knottin scorpion toxin-like domain-containing protein n=1 Tax=Genlisea aurea TaxID=192259 RepID=S8DW13_9LAMI|nr:hypothetical protein M569_10663 [Genlisea aurea]